MRKSDTMVLMLTILRPTRTAALAFLLVAGIVAGVEQEAGVRCYMCVSATAGSCSDEHFDVKSSQVTDDCQFCSTTVTSSSVMRSCSLIRCFSVDGFGSKTTCCRNQDLCNGPYNRPAVAANSDQQQQPNVIPSTQATNVTALRSGADGGRQLLTLPLFSVAVVLLLQ